MTEVDDIFWMEQALLQAQAGALAGEVPVGAVLLHAGVCVAQAHNAPIALHDPTAHAEIQVLRSAAAAFGNYRLPGSVLYVTLEPCAMCIGAMIHARVERLVFAAFDPRTGAAGSAIDLLSHPAHNHRIQVTAGVLAEPAGSLLREFFRARRK